MLAYASFVNAVCVFCCFRQPKGAPSLIAAQIFISFRSERARHILTLLCDRARVVQNLPSSSARVLLSIARAKFYCKLTALILVHTYYVYFTSHSAADEYTSSVVI